ncbi:IS30 family transposase [Kitasatospora sp. A2-31]|uniref:IS30 family transposase n=2 Tax=Kitasatospora sp. A2-31 TaxID=2916414 RepID=UPI001EE83E80|nr:IS30 family transposase [Kitasatospora sp. A2-31]MCG6493232.1 IS30 family transposase [Kitasatospora sp. A2-31]MCG6494183.1 IS30 family transposase [Kitasatospora sp. A2-31]MCG6495145.1 IS30 family transposase [Kitasatospora sp. A2-31]MCG6499870.1 IS30 family transposase [Kitasatospora sp. A2-31]
MGFAEACAVVGINVRTGKRWRNGRNASGRKKAAPPIYEVVPPPVAPAEPAAPETSRYLSETERIHIADRLREKATIRAIAAELGRSPSTVSREIRRNRTVLPKGGWYYRPHAAQRRADQRRPRPKPSKIGQSPELRDFIQDRLAIQWSPEQICRALREGFPEHPGMHVSHETVYQALYTQGRGDLHRDLTRNLRTGRRLRRPRRQTDRRRSRPVKNMLMISERPVEAADRAVAGHWEGDLIVGPKSRSAIATLVERSSRYLVLVHLPTGHTSNAVRRALTDVFKTLPEQLQQSLTWDQGCEMAAHRGFTRDTGVPVYFCEPASPWQRGSNENTNGLLRQYFPKGTDLSVHTPEHLAAVADRLNSRPRKTLGWETPAERLLTLLAA